MASKAVLVTVDKRTRIVNFTRDGESDVSVLTAAVKTAFSDVISGDREFFLQM